MERKKIILVDTSYPINSRNRRILDSLKDIYGDENVKYVSWNRDGRNIDAKDTANYILSLNSPIGDRLKKLRNLFDFRRFLKTSLSDFAPDVIIASHWDSLILCASLKKKQQILIYENLDMPTVNAAVFKILRYLEKLSLNKTDAISYASRFYLPYYKWFRGQHFVLENKVPESMAIPIEHTTQNEKKLLIAFNGGLRYAEIFKNLFEAVDCLDNVNVDIYGGDSGEGDVIMKYAKGKKNIKFHGPYKYEEIPIIYSKMDIVWAVYPSNDFNVKLAISNKYHESIFYGVPGIFAKDTRLGEWVDANKIGYQVDGYSVESIRNLIVKIRDNKDTEIAEKKHNMESLSIDEKASWKETISPLINYIKTR